MSASLARLATPTGVAMLDGLLNETLRLALQARAYIAESGRPDAGGDEASLTPLVEACELSRLAARLGFCVAWLLARRAVHEGELTADEASGPGWRLEGRAICLDTGSEAPGELPPALVDMLEQSRALYLRVARLDRRLDG
jgi:regulator of CtrA degradation